MDNQKVYGMLFRNVYPMLIKKAERKGKTIEEVYELTAWLTGYSKEQLESLLTSETTYGDFFLDAPVLNEKRKNIKGSICGVKIEEITEPLMQEIRYLDKLVDELAKGKTVEKILSKYE